MSLAFKRIKVYVRVLVLIVAVAAIALVLVNNRANRVAFWFFGLTDEKQPINVIWLMLCTAAATLICWWGSRFVWGVWREMREVKRLQAVRQAAKEQESRAKELNERERRLDEKLKRAISDEDDATG